MEVSPRGSLINVRTFDHREFDYDRTFVTGTINSRKLPSARWSGQKLLRSLCVNEETISTTAVGKLIQSAVVDTLLTIISFWKRERSTTGKKSERSSRFTHVRYAKISIPLFSKSLICSTTTILFPTTIEESWEATPAECYSRGISLLFQCLCQIS